MKHIDHGGRAFPSIAEFERGDGDTWIAVGVGGMSMRQWYAGKALQGLIAQGQVNLLGVDVLAATAHAIADAMITQALLPPDPAVRAELEA